MEGNFLQPLHTDEKSKLHPTSFYGLTKLQQEEMLSLVCQSIKMPYTILRYQNVYGEGQSLLNPYTGILSIFSTQILNGKEIQIFEDGLPSRDFIHIEDTVEATIRSLEKVETNQQIINVGTGIASSVLYIAQLLVEKYGRDTDLIVTGKFRLGDIRHHYAELSKMKKILDFEPQLKVSQGLEKFTQWVLQQPILENNFEKSLVEMKKKGFLK
jgi:dTDP-L-rhamnose 4-epimerase